MSMCCAELWLVWNMMETEKSRRNRAAGSQIRRTELEASDVVGPLQRAGRDPDRGAVHATKAELTIVRQPRRRRRFQRQITLLAPDRCPRAGLGELGKKLLIKFQPEIRTVGESVLLGNEREPSVFGQMRAGGRH